MTAKSPSATSATSTQTMVTAETAIASYDEKAAFVVPVRVSRACAVKDRRRPSPTRPLLAQPGKVELVLRGPDFLHHLLASGDAFGSLLGGARSRGLRWAGDELV